MIACDKSNTRFTFIRVCRLCMSRLDDKTLYSILSYQRLTATHFAYSCLACCPTERFLLDYLLVIIKIIFMIGIEALFSSRLPRHRAYLVIFRFSINKKRLAQFV